MAAAWFFGRAQWRRRWIGLIGLALLAGLIAGVVMASFAGIRRTSTALERLVDAGRLPGVALEMTPAVDVARVVERIRAAPSVEFATSIVPLVGRDDVEKNWWLVVAPMEDGDVTPVMVEGRQPVAVDEVMVSRHTTEKFDLGVGSTFTIDFYSVEQFAFIDSDSTVEPAGPRPLLHVVGVYLEPRDVERSAAAPAVRASPEFARAYGRDAAINAVAVRLAGEDTAELEAAVADVNDELGLSEANGNAIQISDELRPARDAERETRAVVVIGLLAFALVALVAGVVAHGQALRRWVSRSEAAQGALSAMGATRRERRAAHMVAMAPHVVVATVVGVTTAWLMSPLFPIGVLRQIEPEPGLRADGLVLAVGGVLTAMVLAAVTYAVSRLATRPGLAWMRPRDEHPVVKAAELGKVPVPAVVGVRYAVRPGRARVALPVRTALTAAILGVAGLVATATFTSSLERLESTPARFGVPWDLSLELLSAPDGEDALADVVADPRIASVGVAAIALTDVSVDGARTPVSLLTTVKGSPQVVVSAGRLPSGGEEIAVGPRLLAEIGKEIGDDVDMVDRDGSASRATVVGTVFSLEYQSDAFNSGVLYVDDDASAVGADAFAVVLVSFAEGVDAAAVTAELDARHPFAVMNESFPNAPPEVINLAQLSGLPRALALFLGFLAVASLIHALVVTGRARRRDLGVLRALGFTTRQVAAVLVSTTATLVLTGVVIGVPVGLVAGATAWRLVARGIFVATDSTYPVLTIAAVAMVAVLGGLLVASLPARAAIRLEPAQALRSE